MKTPEEIKKSLELCSNQHDQCFDFCPYAGVIPGSTCFARAMGDALDYIEQLEERISLMLIQMRGDCGTCKHRSEEDGPCNSCVIDEARPAWEYEGLPELTKKGASA